MFYYKFYEHLIGEQFNNYLIIREMYFSFSYIYPSININPKHLGIRRQTCDISLYRILPGYFFSHPNTND